MTSHTKKDITLIDKPLNIGAEDLIRGVEYTHCGDLHLLDINKFRRKKWIHRYCIISEGFLYIYLDMSSKKVEHVYSLKEFSSAQAQEPQEGKSHCFHLIFKSLQSPQLFACDTDERKREWVERFSKVIEYIQMYSLSADSGFGSAEAVPGQIANSEKEQYSYPSVFADKVPKAVSHTDYYTNVATTSGSDSDYDYEPVSDREIDRKQMFKGTGNQVSRGKETGKDTTLVKQPKGPEDAGKSPGKTRVPFLDELKSTIEEKRSDLKINESRKRAKVLKDNKFPQTFHKSSSEQSFVSVRGKAVSETPKYSIQASNGEHVNKDDSKDDRRDSSLVFESTEPQHFSREEYVCNDKMQIKRELAHTPEGTFAIFREESSESQVLSVKIDNGVTHFRIYPQNGMISLFRSQQYNTFSSLNDLLGYYMYNDLPKHRVRLVRGYRSGSK